MAARGRRSGRALRAALRSPGRPPVARRADLARLEGGDRGGSHERRRGAGGGSHLLLLEPGGLRRSGGMPPPHLSVSAKPVSGRHLIVRGARGDRAAPGPRPRGSRQRAGRRPSALDDLARAAAQRGHPPRRPRAPRHGRAMARRSLCAAARGVESRWGTKRCVATCRIASPARSRDRTKRRSRVRASPGRAAGTGGAGPGDGLAPGAPSRSRARLCRSTSPGTRRCASATRPSDLGPVRPGPRRAEARADRLPADATGAEGSPCARPRSRHVRGTSFVAPGIVIGERPAEAADRAGPGRWEGDLISGLRRPASGHAGRARDAPHPAAPSPADARSRRGAAGEERTTDRRSRRRGGQGRHRRRDHDPARTAPSISGLGPGGKDGAARRAEGPRRSPSPLLRPPEPLAARHEREHQRALAPALPQGRGPQPARARRARGRRRRARRQAAQDARMENPRRGAGRSSPRHPRCPRRDRPVETARVIRDEERSRSR